MCWVIFLVLVLLLTVEPFALANYNPNAFALAFLLVPGVYILHRCESLFCASLEKHVFIASAQPPRVCTIIAGGIAIGTSGVGKR